MQVLPFLSSFITSLLYFKSQHKAKKRIPKIKFKRLELLPSIRLEVSGKVLHIHHWVWSVIILSVSFVVDLGFLETTFAKGFLVGGFIEGIFYKDRHIIQRK